MGSSASEGRKTIPHWEYCALHVQYTSESTTPDDGLFSLIFYEHLAHDELRTPATTSVLGVEAIDTWLAKLGIQGWELVSVVGVENRTSFYFKKWVEGNEG
jgi:hypothetical protein